MKPAKWVLLATLILSCAGAGAQTRTAQEAKTEAQARLEAFPHKNTPEASISRGTIVFMNYCVNCHGVEADGNGRAARMYDPRPSNLRASLMNDQYKETIVRRGGKAMARSEFMPPWGEELTDEQIGDLVRYLKSIASPAISK
jgi:mono/diheme cytochrome c family protein